MITLPANLRSDPPPTQPPAPTRRDARLDALRGLFLVVMATMHLGTPLARVAQEPLGYNTSAEGFIFLSACMAGLVYGRLHTRSGWRAMAGRVWLRARVLYLVHLALVVPAALAACLLVDYLPPLANHFHRFLLDPWGGLALMPVLLHQPPLFDILPMYVVFLGVTPLCLAAAHRWGWMPVLLLSASLWLVAQSRFLAPLTGFVSQPPFSLTPFNLLAWQFLWAAGVALGATSTGRAPGTRRYPVPLLVVAAGIVGVAFLSRHGFWPQAWFDASLFRWMNKWTLGPLRLLNLAALVIVLQSWNPRVPARLTAPLALLGRHSLAVFAFHLPLVVAAGAALRLYPHSALEASIVGLLVIAAMFAWAGWLEWRRTAAQARGRINATGT